MWYWGFSTGPSDIIPFLAVIGSLSLILISNIASLFVRKIGAVIGIFSILLICSWSFTLLIEFFYDDFSLVELIFYGLPNFTSLVSLLYCGKFTLLNKELSWKMDKKVHPVLQTILSLLPISSLLLWLIS